MARARAEHYKQEGLRVDDALLSLTSGEAPSRFSMNVLVDSLLDL